MAAVAAIVIKCQGTPPADKLAVSLRAVAAQARLAGWPVERIVAYAWSEGTHPGPEVYAYLWLRAPQSTPAKTLPAFELEVAGLPAVAQALERVDDRQGASHGESAPVHYVVETDIAPGQEKEVIGWYDHEHMAGLAAVPGTVRAQRFTNLSASESGSSGLASGLASSVPRLYACYDLLEAATRDTPEWLAVRATDWASRARPHFRNTKRTTFERLFDITP